MKADPVVLGQWFVGLIAVACVCAAAVGAWVLHLEELRDEEAEADLFDLSDAEVDRRISELEDSL